MEHPYNNYPCQSFITLRKFSEIYEHVLWSNGLEKKPEVAFNLLGKVTLVKTYGGRNTGEVYSIQCMQMVNLCVTLNNVFLKYLKNLRYISISVPKDGVPMHGNLITTRHFYIRPSKFEGIWT